MNGIVLSAGWRPSVICLKCRSPLDLPIGNGSADWKASCAVCGAAYTISDGIINFGVTDVFYDDHGFTSTGRKFSNNAVGRLGLYFARSHFLHDITRAEIKTQSSHGVIRKLSACAGEPMVVVKHI